MIKVGQRVKITNYGGMYSSYEDMAKHMGLRYFSNRELVTFDFSQVMTVVGVSPHLKFPDKTTVVGIRGKDINGNFRDHIIHIDSLEVVSENILPESLFEI